MVHYVEVDEWHRRHIAIAGTSNFQICALHACNGCVRYVNAGIQILYIVDENIRRAEFKSDTLNSNYSQMDLVIILQKYCRSRI